MAAYISFQPNDFFNTVLYTGTGSSNAITGVGFSSDFTWLKCRSLVKAHYAFDTVRGATKAVIPNDTDVEDTNAEFLKSWESDGFTVGTSGGVNTSSATFASWNWKMGTTSGLTGGTITPTGYSLNTTARQSIIAYTGNGTSGATVPHGLGAVPDLIIVKCLSHTGSWPVYNTAFGATKYFELNSDAAVQTGTSRWNDTAPTSTVFSLGNTANVNENLRTYVAYCFANKKGYSQVGSYEGNANSGGPFVNTGFRPAFLMVKNSATTSGWYLYDNKRPTAASYWNDNATTLIADAIDVESTAHSSSGHNIDFLSNGFKIRTSSSARNGSGNDIAYVAFAAFPIVSSNDVPTVAR